MNSQDLRNLSEAYNNVYEATGRDEMLAANIARAKAPKPTTGGTVRTPGGPVSTPGGPVKTPTSGPVAQAPKPSGLLGSLDKMARDAAGEIGGRIGEREGRNRTGNLPVISDIGGALGRRQGTQKGQQMYDKAKETVGSLLKQDYEYDAFDIILEYLVYEGYADTNENALVIMANMSEEWRQDIVEAFGFRDFRQSSQPKKATEPKPAPPTVQSSGGAGGKVTVDKKYPATLGGKKGVKSTDDSGTDYFMPNVGKSNMPDYSKAQYKNKYTGKYQNIPSSQGASNPQSHLSRTGVPRVHSRTANYGIPD